MKKKIFLNDVALRESAQVAGGAMSPDDQLTYIKYLCEHGIDAIEIGFPSSSDDEMDKCRHIVQYVNSMECKKRPILSGLSLAMEESIMAVKKAGCDMVHIYIPVSDELMLTQFDAAKYGDTPEGKRKWVVSQFVSMVKFARSIGFKHIECSPEDAARTSPEYVARIVEAVIRTGATRVNIPDTTGLRIGNEFGELIKYLFANVPNIHDAIISVHCHNDSSHADHNAVQAVINGATQVEGTFWGLGERSGMTRFEAILMVINTRKDLFSDFEIGFNKAMCVEIVNFVANALGTPVPRHAVVVGSQNSLCSSGTHQAIEAKAKRQGRTSAYYGWNPEEFGHSGVQTVVTQFSGKAGIDEKLKELGYAASIDQLQKIANEVNKLSAAKKGRSVSDRELVVIADEVIAESLHQIEVMSSVAVSGTDIPIAGVCLRSADGETVTVSQVGNGPIDALMKAVKKGSAQLYPILKHVEIELEDWRPLPVTVGTEALGDVYVRIKVTNGEIRFFSGRSVNVDTNKASAQAYANCLSLLVAFLLKQ